MVSAFNTLKSDLNNDIVLIISPPGSSPYRPPPGTSLIPLTKAKAFTCSGHYVQRWEHHEFYTIRSKFFNNEWKALFAPNLFWFPGIDKKNTLIPTISEMKTGESVACIAQIREVLYGGTETSKISTKENYRNLFQYAIKERLKLVLIIESNEEKIPGFLLDKHRPTFDAYHGVKLVYTRQASKTIADYYASKHNFQGIPTWIYATRQPICSELLIKDIADSGISNGSWPSSPETWLTERANHTNSNSPFNSYLRQRLEPSRLTLNGTLFWEWFVKTFFPDRKDQLFWTKDWRKINELGLNWMTHILD